MVIYSTNTLTADEIVVVVDTNSDEISDSVKLSNEKTSFKYELSSGISKDDSWVTDLFV